VAKTNYSLGFAFALMIHMIALFLLGMVVKFNLDNQPDVEPLAEVLTLTLVEEMLSDNPSPKMADTAPRPQTDTHMELLRVPQPMTEHAPLTDLSSDMIEIPKHPLSDLTPPPPVVNIQTPSALPDKTLMPTLSTLLSSQDITDAASLHSDSTGGVQQGALIAPATKDQAIHPKYPMASRRKGEQGRVILDVLVSKEGKARSVTIISTSGFKELDTAAKEAVMDAKFKPGERNGKAVEASARMTILFQLNQN
jgi:protein TonB